MRCWWQLRMQKVKHMGARYIVLGHSMVRGAWRTEVGLLANAPADSLRGASHGRRHGGACAGVAVAFTATPAPTMPVSSQQSRGRTKSGHATSCRLVENSQVVCGTLERRDGFPAL